MSDRNEHLRLSASWMNIAAGGSFVAAIATVPLNAFTTDRLDFSTSTDLVLSFTFESFFLHGIAQLLLHQVTST